MSSFTQATSIHPLSPTSYSANFPPDWCIGSVPNGGYVSSTILTAAALHSSITLSHLQQPHVICLHLDFLRRTSIGPAEICFKELKLGSRTSNLSVSLLQHADPRGSSSSSGGGGGEAAVSTGDDRVERSMAKGKRRECIHGTLILSNLVIETGISLPTNWALSPRPGPLSIASSSFFTNLLEDRDEYYTEWHDIRFPDFRPAGKHLRMFVRRKLPTMALPDTTPTSHQSPHNNYDDDEAAAGQAMIDQYITFRPPLSPSSPSQRFTHATLGYVTDTFPQIVESLYSPMPKTPSGLAFWYPTLTLALDIKRLLPPEGVDWLFVRVLAKSIKNGRMDLDVTVLDPMDGSLVASSQHVALIVGSDRNTSGREMSKQVQKPEEAARL